MGPVAVTVAVPVAGTLIGLETEVVWFRKTEGGAAKSEALLRVGGAIFEAEADQEEEEGAMEEDPADDPTAEER